MIPIMNTKVILAMCILLTGPFFAAPLSPPYLRAWDLIIKENTAPKTIQSIRTEAWDFKSLKNSQTFSTVLRLLKDIPPYQVDPANTAFWINAYNIAALKLIIEHYPISSLDEIGSQESLYNNPAIRISNKLYSLNDIKRLCVKEGDKRILFALSDGSLSSPSIYKEGFKPHLLDEQLSHQMDRFLSNESKGVDVKNAYEVFVSSIFQDPLFFLGKDDVIGFLKTIRGLEIEDQSLYFFPTKTRISEY